MPPASVGVCRERRRLRWSRCASRARAARRSCSASARPCRCLCSTTSTLPPRGRMTMSRDCRSVSGDLRSTQVWALAEAAQHFKKKFRSAITSSFLTKPGDHTTFRTSVQCVALSRPPRTPRTLTRLRQPTARVGAMASSAKHDPMRMPTKSPQSKRCKTQAVRHDQGPA